MIQSDGPEVSLAEGDWGGVVISSSVIEVDVLDRSQSSEVLDTHGEISDISTSSSVLMGLGVWSLSVDMLNGVVVLKVDEVVMKRMVGEGE